MAAKTKNICNTFNVDYRQLPMITNNVYSFFKSSFKVSDPKFCWFGNRS